MSYSYHVFSFVVVEIKTWSELKPRRDDVLVSRVQVQAMREVKSSGDALSLTRSLRAGLVACISGGRPMTPESWFHFNSPRLPKNRTRLGLSSVAAVCKSSGVLIFFRRSLLGRLHVAARVEPAPLQVLGKGEIKMYKRVIALLFMSALFAISSVSASAQVQRTFVSGLGNNSNPCSRTAPCRTFHSGHLTDRCRG